MNHFQAFKLSGKGRIASAVSMALVLPLVSAGAVAGNITPTGNTSVSQVGKVDVVNIANPNSNGLSHNQYKDFNVSEAGAVLNNSLIAGQSQLAGNLGANSHLTGTAKVILNEVVSKNPSLLLGQQEVFGMAADYVLANPNGITGKNIGFINTNRAALVVGKPTIADERLAGFAVGDRQSKTLALSGTVDGDKRLDLLAPKVDIDGAITATDAINVITGRNQVDYDSLTVKGLEGYQPHVTLDGQILGSMQTGRIRLHNTDSDATQTLQGTFAADTGFDAAADTLNVADSVISNTQGDITLTGRKALTIGGEVTTQRVEGEPTKQKLEDRVKLTNSSYQQAENFVGSQVTGDTITLAGGDIRIEGSQLAANAIDTKGDTVNITGVITTDTTSSTARNSKGLWFNENEALTTAQQQHKASLSATGNVTVDAATDLTLSGATIAGADVALSAGNELNAAAQHTENATSAINRYARQTADLKTGAHTITDAAQTGYQTVIKGDSVRLDSAGAQRLEGVALDATSVALHSGQDLTVANSSTSNRQTDEEDFKYWGGIGGGETHINNKTQTALTGSQINADNVTLSSDAGIHVIASQVAATNEANIAATGDVNISHDFSTNQDYVETRHGTAFNITDKKQATDRIGATTVGSKVSAANIALAGENIAITGSQIAAADRLNVKAQSGLTTDIANATDIATTQGYDLTSEAAVNVDVDFKNGLAGVKDSLSIDASGSLKGVDTIITKGTGSAVGNTLSAKNATLNGQQVSLKGSTITASESAVISGDDVTTGAGEALTAVDSKVVKSTGPEVYVRGGLSGIKVGVSIGTDQVIHEHNEYQAVNSAINAGNQVDLAANATLTNQGAQITGAQVDLAAKDIVNEAAYDRQVDRQVVAGGNAALQGFFGGTPLIGGAISLSGQGVGETTEVKTAHTTGIEAADSVNMAAVDSIVDAGSALKAATINLNADDYAGTAAYDSTITTTHSGKGDVSVSAGTNDFINVDVAANGSGEYQYLQTGNAKAVKGSLTGNSVTINGGTRAVAAQDVDANTYTITGTDEARIAQNADKQWTTIGGAELGGSVALSINTATAATGAVVPLPSLAGHAGFDYLGVEDSQAHAATVNVKALSVGADDLAQIDGANITSDTVVIKGNQANLLAAQDKHRAIGVAMGGNAAFSLDLAKAATGSSDIGVGAKLGVINETSNKATGATVTTGDLTITANAADKALTVEGADITAATVNLSNSGDVAVIAAQSKDDVGNFGIGGHVSTAADNNNLDAHLTVNTDNSVYHTLGTVKADTLSINSGHDVTLQTNVDAGTLTTASANDLALSSAQDVVRKVNVTTALAVDGSPVTFVEKVTSGDILNALKDDFNNGTVLGVSAKGEAGFDVDHQKTTQQATINAGDFNAAVGSQAIAVTAAKVKATQSNLNGATVNSSNNDDFVHSVGANVDAKTFSVPNFVKSIPTLIKDAFAGKPVETPINVDVTYDWDDSDGANTKADVEL